MSRALTDLFPQFPALDSPNALLALSYLSHLPSSIQPNPIERTGCGYHELRPSPLASASFIRQAMKEGKYDLAASALPEAELFLEAEKEKDICTEDALDTALLFHLRSLSPSDLSGIAGVCEGLENRILSCARRACSRDELLALCKTKRYTWTRLSRICTCALLGMTNQDLQDYPSPQYLRVLGFRRQALPLLHAISKRSALPLVTRACDAPAQSRLFSLDQRAQDLWSLGCSCKGARQAGRDLRSSCVIV
jgi:predicted nucleotidyltransferase